MRATRSAHDSPPHLPRPPTRYRPTHESLPALEVRRSSPSRSRSASLYTLPNFFPEVPAVQVSSSKATRQGRHRAARRRSRTRSRRRHRRIAARRSTPTGIKVRFADTDTQLKAKDALQAKLGDNYIVALNLLSASPRWLTAIGALPMYLGLDLRGGVHFLLQVDMKARARQGRRPLHRPTSARCCATKKVQYARRRARGHERRRPLPRRGRARPRRASRSRRRSPTSRCARPDAAAASCGSSARSSPRRRSASRTAPSSRTSRSCATASTSSASPSRSSSSRAPTASSCSCPGVQDTARAKDILGRTATLEIRMVNDEPGALEAAIARPACRSAATSSPSAAARRCSCSGRSC